MNQYQFFIKRGLLIGLVVIGMLGSVLTQAASIDISQTPLTVGGSSTPLVMLVMGRDHKLYYEAYNDASDLDGDGVIDTTYKPDKMDYFGLFDSFLCYTYGSDKFTPVSKTITKKCPGQWSGDFLNYITTSRMDALRKVLYGGYRIPANDTASGTVLERSYIPQDAHSWGKEYESIQYDGYSISDYTPLSLPAKGTRHLFANTTLLNDTDKKPLLRVLNDSKYRIWEWVSIERPVAGNKCLDGGSGPNCETDGTSTNPGHPNSAADFQNNFIAPYANAAHRQGSSTVSTINGSGNPFGDSDNYLTVFNGTLNISVGGTYNFAVDGDDAVEVIIDGQVVASWYGGHGKCGCQTHFGSIDLAAGSHTLIFHHEEATGGDNYYLYWKVPGSSTWALVPATAFSDLTQSVYNFLKPASTIRDYTVRVDACVSGLRTEGNPDASEYCTGYPVDSSTPTVFKPAGLLQQYGQNEPERMAFGLLTGSYMKNTDGGVLRKNIGPFSKTGDTGNEIDRSTGVFSNTVNGIVKTLSNLTVTGFGSGHQYSCGWITTRPVNPGDCRMWGNPLGEMMYESLRYFAGRPNTSAPAPTKDFTYTETTDDGLSLPKPNWQYPFRQNGGYTTGAKCFMLTISDINPSYDTDKLPGTAFGSFAGDLLGMDVAALAKTIWTNEEQSNPAFIGESLDNTPSYDGAPTAKTVLSLGRIRGLSPEEPTKQGGFYSASVAYFGNAQGIGDTPGKQRVETMSVALASPLPRIEIPVGSGTITLVPFAKSVGATYGFTISADRGKFQPTNQIVDFYVEKIANTGEGNQDPNDNAGRPHGIFRINYEDVEQGADHDMDAIIRYEFWVLADNTLKVQLDSNYAAGSIIQHVGYVISGTDGQDGIYLDVRDEDTTTSQDLDYFLDTPLQTTTDANGMTTKRLTWAQDAWKHKASSPTIYGPLPLTATRLFRPATGANVAAGKYIEHGPLWYAAKWGGFGDRNKNGLPDDGEWDSNKSGEPNNYFLVTNAGTLKKQLSNALSAILSTTGSASVVALNSSKAYGPQNDVYQAQFNSGDWSGNVLALNPKTTATGTLKADITWDAGEQVNKVQSGDRQILTYKPSTDSGVAFRWPNNPASPALTEFDTEQAQALSTPKVDGTYDSASYAKGKERLEFLRGDNNKEGQGTDKYRKRGSDLGDFVNSNPIFVNGSTADAAMLYVGSNDGMVHGFSAVDGAEKIAYVPSIIFRQLALLTNQDYNTTTGGKTAVTEMLASKHRYYVDGGIDVAEKVSYAGTAHTVLVGRLGAGGQGVFALDITSPANFSESNANSLVLWEFSDADDPDLGFTFGRSWITQANNGKWVAIFGNGYNSGPDSARPEDVNVGTGQGVLYIVDIETGKLIKKLDAGIGSEGLSSPAIYDSNGDEKTDTVYAGDLKGNLWKFDVSDPSPANWSVNLLFKANIAGVVQPITSAPYLMVRPDKKVMVLFGTGRYLATSDMTNTDTQSYYGILDEGSASTVTRGQLLQQTFTDTVTIDGQPYRISSDNEMTASYKGWYIDLPGKIGTQSGSERVYEDSVAFNGRIIFTSKVPALADPTAAIKPCNTVPPGGKSYVNALDGFTGRRLTVSFANVDDQGVATNIKTSDKLAPTSQSFDGISGGISVTLNGYVLMSRPPKEGESIGKAIPIEVLKMGEETSTTDNSGRRTWRQLQ